MSTHDKTHKGNTRKEGLGFEGHHTHKLKPKKVTKEKLVSALTQGEELQGSSLQTAHQVAQKKSGVSAVSPSIDPEVAGKGDFSKKDIADKKSKKIKKCF